jgi:hypothetical protein
VTLIELPDLLQGSEEWLEQRRGMVTASVVGQLVTPSTVKVAKNDNSRALTAQLVAERITGWTDPVYVSDDMLRGHEDEPRRPGPVLRALRPGPRVRLHGAHRGPLEARLQPRRPGG